MNVRKALAVAALGLLASTSSALADTTAGLGTQYAGAIASTTAVDNGGEDRVGTEEITGKCSYVGVTTPSGNIRFAFAGATASYSTSISQPLVTVTQCRLVSPAQGIAGEPPTLTASFGNGVACPGAACVTASVTTNEWPLRPVQVCVSGYAVLGPNPVVQVNLAEKCTTQAV